jgi:cytochrome c oxidase subunit II
VALEFGPVQIGLLAAFFAIAAFFALVFLAVALASVQAIPLERVRGVAYALRRPWFVFLLVVMVLALSVLSFWLPYASGGKGATDVRVVGGQFYWSLSPASFRQGEEVRFRVSSADVNHGFGLYDPKGRLIGSVQAMPGYENDLVVTLDQPGRYTIDCLEYCGLSHHLMTREFTVTP